MALSGAKIVRRGLLGNVTAPLKVLVNISRATRAPTRAFHRLPRAPRVP
jgi:hypothetical protein